MSSGYGPNSKFDATSDEYRNEHDRLFGKPKLPDAPDHIDIPHWSSWKHNRSGDRYRVVLITNADASPDRKDEYTTMVCYEDTDGCTWSRTKENFLEAFTLQYT